MNSSELKAKIPSEKKHQTEMNSNWPEVFRSRSEHNLVSNESLSVNDERDVWVAVLHEECSDVVWQQIDVLNVT